MVWPSYVLGSIKNSEEQQLYYEEKQYDQSPMRVGILGSGEVGQKLGDGFIEIGYSVKISTRDPKKDPIKSWLASHKQDASLGSSEETALFGDMIVIATPWSATKEVLKSANPQNFANKLVIDVTNPLDFSKGMPPTLAVGGTDSAGETIQRLLPQAKVVKAFNIIGNTHMFHPNFPGGPPTMFICGNDLESKKTVTDILTKFGWENIDIGGIEGSRLLEPLAMLWIMYYIQKGTGDHAFKLLKK